MNYLPDPNSFQEAWVGVGANARLVRLPASDAEVVPGVAWGSPDYFNTPAYWAVRCQWEGDNPDYVAGNDDLVREVAFCLLGGYGIRYEVNQAAFLRMEANGLFEPRAPLIDEACIRRWLTEPLLVDGRPTRYRFPNQRARRLAGMLAFFALNDLSGLSAGALRTALMTIEGVGPKIASWIVRNCLGSDEVAIIDVHLIRACTNMRVFPEEISLPRDYQALEARFLCFSKALDIKPSVLDAVIWSEIRKTPSRHSVR